MYCKAMHYFVHALTFFLYEHLNYYLTSDLEGALLTYFFSFLIKLLKYLLWVLVKYTMNLTCKYVTTCSSSLYVSTFSMQKIMKTI